MKYRRLIIFILQTQLVLMYSLQTGDWALNRFKCAVYFDTNLGSYEIQKRNKRSDEKFASTDDVYNEYASYSKESPEGQTKKNEKLKLKVLKKSHARKSKKRHHYYHQDISMQESSSQQKSGGGGLYHQTITMGVYSRGLHELDKRRTNKNKKISSPRKLTKPTSKHSNYYHSHHSKSYPKKHSSSEYKESRGSKEETAAFLHRGHKTPAHAYNGSVKEKERQKNANKNANSEQFEKYKREKAQRHSRSEKKANQVVNMIINMAEMGVLNPGCQMCAIKFLENALFGEFAVLANFVDPRILKRIKTIINFVQGGQGQILIDEARKVLNNKAIKAVGKKLAGAAGTGSKALEDRGKAVAKSVIKVENVVKSGEEIKAVANVANGAGNKIKKLLG